MDNLTVQSRHKKLSPSTADNNGRFDSIDAEELLELFPLPRYFQIHFSHVHDNHEHAKLQVDELKQSIHRVEQKLDLLLAAMVQQQL